MNNKYTNMTLILKDDIQKIILKHEYELISYIKNDDMGQISDFKLKLFSELETFYELNELTDHLNLSKKVYLKNYIDRFIHETVNRLKERLHNKKKIYEKMIQLKQLKLPEQRSKEWYEIRERMLTASSLADAIGEGHFSTKEELLLQKCGGPRPNIPFEIVEWGVMYEPVATKLYEVMNKVTVLEFGLIPHPEFKIFGASPDGICDIDSPEDYIGRMLEIKCPPKRQFTKDVPKHYWMQMQGQLESCDLEECDFLQVKISEYLSKTHFKDDIYQENDTIQEGYSSLKLPKGLLLAFIKYNLEGNPTIHYEYCEWGKSYEVLTQWAEKIIKERDPQSYDEVEYHWWKIERYECTLVGRDRQWWLDTQPKIIDFWEDVEHYRKTGIQSILDKKEEKRIKKIKLKEEKKHHKKQPKKNIFEIDKDIVHKIQSEYMLDSDSE